MECEKNVYISFSRGIIGLRSSQEGPSSCLPEYASILNSIYKFLHFRHHVFLKFPNPTYMFGIKHFVPVRTITCIIGGRWAWVLEKVDATPSPAQESQHFMGTHLVNTQSQHHSCPQGFPHVAVLAP